MSNLQRRPLESLRFTWRKVRHPFGWDCWQAETGDGGHLSVLVTDEPTGLHLSISHRSNGEKPEADRYPTWDEIADAREQFLPDDRTFVMHLPPRAEYVNLHQSTFHLWELQAAERGWVGGVS